MKNHFGFWMFSSYPVSDRCKLSLSPVTFYLIGVFSMMLQTGCLWLLFARSKCSPIYRTQFRRLLRNLIEKQRKGRVVVDRWSALFIYRRSVFHSKAIHWHQEERMLLFTPQICLPVYTPLCRYMVVWLATVQFYKKVNYEFFLW